MIVVNQRIFVRRDELPGRWPGRAPPRDEVLASIFDTLLSSQGSDAHQHLTSRSGSGATLQSYSHRILGVKSRRSLSEAVDRARLALREVSHCTSLFDPPRPPCRGPRRAGEPAAFRWGLPWDRPASRRTAVVSVPPCRADVENIRRMLARKTNPQVRSLRPVARPPGSGVPGAAAPRSRGGSRPR
jgi:hypothetical protein